MDRRLPAGTLHRLWTVADIYASSHCSEGFGLTIAEAMAAGKPVVATDFGGSTDFLDASCGYPVPGEPSQLEGDHGHYTEGGAWVLVDEDALAETLVRAADAVERGDDRIGRAARDRIARQLSYEAVGALIDGSFRATIDEPPAPPADRAARSPGCRIACPSRRPISAGTSAPSRSMRTAPRWRTALGWTTTTSPPTGSPSAPAGSIVSPDFGRIIAHWRRRRIDASIFYADDVAVETDHPVDQLRLKPELDVTLLACQDYVGAPLIVRAAELAALGGLRLACGTAAVADLLFRAHARGYSIVRIPEVLLAHPGRRVRPRPATIAPCWRCSRVLSAHAIVPGRAPASWALARRFTPTTHRSGDAVDPDAADGAGPGATAPISNSCSTASPRPIGRWTS